jgi:outer membrane immunogenic protein
MKKVALAAAVLVIGTVSASAADLAARPYTKAPPVVDPAYNWTGFYIGGNVGYSERDYDWRYTNPLPATIVPFGMSTNGGIYGAQAGAQYQFNQIVVGIEYAYTERFDSSTASNVGCGPNPTLALLTCNVHSNSLQTLGGKLGWAGWNNWLIYASGGWAQTRSSTTVFTTGGPRFDFSNRRTHDGAYAGVGFDYVIWKGGFVDLIVGAEYQHIWIDTNFHGSSVDAFAPLGANGRNIGGDEDLVRAKLSLKFNPFQGPVVAKY